MNKLLQKRLVQIESEEAINSLESSSVVYSKNGPMRVFDKRNGDMLTFYYHHTFERDAVTELTTPRGYLCNIGNMIAFSPSGYDKRVVLTQEDGERYTVRRDDLVSLGLMQ